MKALLPLMGLIFSFTQTVIAAEPANMRLATVDMQKALQTVEGGKKARGQLESEFNKKKAELQKEESEIKKLHDEFQKQSLVMNEQTRAKKQGELQKRIMELQEKTARSQMEIQKKEQDLTLPIVTNLRDIIKKLAEEKGYNMVLEKNENAVLYSQDKDDLTEEVIKLYNKQHKG